MNESTVFTVINDALWLIVVAGWLLLVGIGLEADKPLSGGIPGHHSGQEPQLGERSLSDRLGEIGVWVLFSLVTLSLPLVLWWIFSVHGG
ncbi:MAG TPA: hypothetical protein PKE45_10045 [Caldilineaceae bacterium]|nr:hypothetical protein [Caldilineaceae bacterium]